MLKDKDKKIKCRVDLKEKPKDKFELEHGTLIIKDPGTGASPVIGKRGGSAILLPLTYKPKRKNGSSIIIVWTKGNLQEEFTVFNCTCSFSAALPCNVTVNKGGQYELVGRPEQGNASIRVTDLRLNDTSFYFSHIWIWNEGPELVIQDEIKLEVVGGSGAPAEELEPDWPDPLRVPFLLLGSTSLLNAAPISSANSDPDQMTLPVTRLKVQDPTELLNFQTLCCEDAYANWGR
ncbi:uncharacterized protein [Narcine bancroftii]|uniref:uncharacterized protein n=1 Tax=Narcine bancroftii TaxID=1343680 RepID=UPI0038318835